MTDPVRTATDWALCAAEQAAIPVFVFTVDAKLVWANLQAQEWFGLSLRTLQRTDLRQASPRSARLLDCVEQAVATRRTVVAMGEALGQGGVSDLHARWAEDFETVTLSILPHSEPSPRASQAAALGFGRMLAHELKNPLASIRGAAQLIAREDDRHAAGEMARLIVHDVDRITRLADHWSGVGDIQIGSPAPVNLNRLAVNAIESVTRANPAHGGIIKHGFDPSLPDACGNADLLHQTVVNLLQNALDAVAGHREPSITVSTRFDTGPRSRNGDVATPLVLCVTDNGAGVPETIGAGIFTPFVTTKPAGEGLGLAFSARIIALHDGQLDYDCEPGRTRFNLRLPVLTEGPR
ncbi:ATP-binding protein [uncultured Maricaulis sp.]|uniref:two-component system sensor histidine kinase NtrB n=1 Tax=uncultured Maricaulis sp. TaxID=174710 RepID=UPI0030DB87A6|tara:strand:- start:130246 stop:131301 length:1056 start_codon:yes stop_codon:yes gene_type:complete